jgi:hypothetical protein
MHGDVLVPVPHRQPVPGDALLCRVQVELVTAHQGVQVVLKGVLTGAALVVIGERLRPQVLDAVVAAEFERDQMLSGVVGRCR